MKTYVKGYAAALLAVLAINLPAAAQDLPGKGKTVRYAQGDSLGSNYVVSLIVSQALKDMGYGVKLSTMNTTLFFQAAAQGDQDIATDINFPQRELAFKAVADQETIIGTGLIIGGGVNGYMIDKKTALAHNITSVDQLKDPKLAGLFGADGKAELISCDPGWSCGDVVDYQLDKFGLKQTVKSVRGKYEALMVDTIAKVNSDKPVLFYTWSPSWVTSTLVPGKDVVWLPTPMDALPPNITARGSALVPNVEGCAGGANPCRMAMASWNWGVVANNAFIAANPAVKALLEEIKFPLSTFSHWEGEIGKNGGSQATINRLSSEWLGANKTQFDQWVATAAKVH
ncbi:MAG TPA: glycine betaine/L-proline ABC transporter substrate-binding protein ProX [Bordetella sp.]